MIPSAMPLYPEAEPYARGMLPVGDGQEIYWETCGNPEGRPALVLHGGPGSGCTPGLRRFFDPAAYRIILFDQRNAGRSTPSASAFTTSLETNTTPHLLRDIERLREHLEVERWLIWGISWGVTLAFVYAEQQPARVAALVLGSITNTTPEEIAWLYSGAARFYPEAFQRFRAGIPEAERAGNLVTAYNRLLNGPDQAVRERAARDWCDWENAIVPHPRYRDAAFRIRFSRIAAHYFAHNAWLEDGQVLRDAHRLAGIPGIMVQGRLDVGGPPHTAWQMARAWPDSQLVIVEGAGHNVSHDEMTARLVEASDHFARAPWR